MNGSEAKIEIFKPLGEAFELMKKILFQPFDLGKWCVIGFAAFLSCFWRRIQFSLQSWVELVERSARQSHWPIPRLGDRTDHRRSNCRICRCAGSALDRCPRPFYVF